MSIAHGASFVMPTYLFGRTLTASGAGGTGVIFLLDLVREGDLGSGRGRGGLGVGDDLDDEVDRGAGHGDRLGFQAGGQAVDLDGHRAVERSFANDFPLDLGGCARLDLERRAASSTVAGGTTDSVTAGRREGPLRAGKLALGLQADGHRPQRGRDGRR